MAAWSVEFDNGFSRRPRMALAPTAGDQTGSRYSLPRGPKLNLGCGPVQPAGWVNIDSSNRAWLANRLWPLDRLLVRLGIIPPTEFGPRVKIHNLLKPLPFADDSVACVYAGEVWEHFEYADAARVTRECFRVLAPGGVLRVCVPDGPAFWQHYLQLYREEMGKPRGERSASALRERVGMYFSEICTRRVWLGSMGHKHKWQFDEIQLAEMFEAAGFTSVERAAFRRSRIPDVGDVERSDFCIVEGVKPPGGGPA
jgi:predicted SAM-dependent methyltransferase